MFKHTASNSHPQSGDPSAVFDRIQKNKYGLKSQPGNLQKIEELLKRLYLKKKNTKKRKGKKNTIHLEQLSCHVWLLVILTQR